MSEEQPQPIINPTLEKPKRNWKKISLILLIALFVISLIGVGLYILIPKLTQEPPSQTQKQATPSAKPQKEKTHPLKNKIIYSMDVIRENGFDKDIYAMNPDGSGEIKIFDLEPSDNTKIASKITLSPKNTYLAWIIDTSIYYIKLNKTTQNLAGKIGPIDNISRPQLWSYSFSPDERKIAVLIGEDENTQKGTYTSLRVKVLEFPSGQLINDFYTARGSGGPDETIPGHKNSSPAWVDNSTIIVYTREKPNNYFASYDIHNGIASKKKIIKAWGWFDINQSKKKIVYTQSNNGGLEVLLANIDGSNKKMVSNLSSPVVPTIKFSPNGKFLIFCQYDGKSVNLHLVDLIKNYESKNACKEGEWNFFVWSPDSDELLVELLGYDVDNKYPPELLTKLSRVGLDGKVVKDLTTFAIYNSEIGSIQYELVGWIY
ncbi:MAG: hypothetical protein A2Z11_02390 [Candidatus Woykebacteria bacterium RBG_16_43_9]|uniref:Dipeptidylpeptidase IV N-terminal domain-containing protein n=1 Tax=Candidatus Woykebacteria bacterium RBG_16_43_9 TaxID=1802596 RepID=A0A1G1WGH0_9BACT|nr:MAG: hypothetical protein A2Z11_02390 [Candidatus Woykebacteria bacterium RBG_16_43_9]